jgi:hypothetical protein
VPDQTATPIVLAVLLSCLAGHEPVHRRLHRAELLIAADDLDHAAVHWLEQREVADDVEQVRRPEHASDELLLARQVRRRTHTEIFGDIAEWYGRCVLPLEVVLHVGADGADTGLIEAGCDEELAGMKQPLVAFVVLDLPRGLSLVRVAAQLVHRRR